MNAYRKFNDNENIIEYKRNNKAYSVLKQRLAGIGLTAAGILSAYISGDGTAALLLVPVGIYTIFYKG